MRCLLVLGLVLLPAVAFAGEDPPPAAQRADAPSLAVNFGLGQPIFLGGANVEVDLRWRHLVIGYSHGWNLTETGGFLSGSYVDAQHLSIHKPWTTGFGVGPSIHVDTLRSFLDARFEAKAHRYEASYGPSDGKVSTSIASYTLFTLGAGVYSTVLPFERCGCVLRGLDASLSVRAWPRVASTLPGGKVVYANATTRRTETLPDGQIGFFGSPFFANLSVGYVFQ